MRPPRPAESQDEHPPAASPFLSLRDVHAFYGESYIVREIESIVAEIEELRITTIIVEQNAVAAPQLAGRAVILEMGEVVFDGSAREVLYHAELRQE